MGQTHFYLTHDLRVLVLKNTGTLESWVLQFGEIYMVTHRQYLVLKFLSKVEGILGVDLRPQLRKSGKNYSPEAFYKFMKKLEDKFLVSSWEKLDDLSIIHRRGFNLTVQGLKAVEEVERYYGSSRLKMRL